MLKKLAKLLTPGVTKPSRPGLRAARPGTRGRDPAVRDDAHGRRGAGRRPRRSARCAGRPARVSTRSGPTRCSTKPPSKVGRLSSYFAQVSVINRRFEMDQRIRFVEHMWRVAYADGGLDPYEDHLVRKISQPALRPSRSVHARAPARSRHGLASSTPAEAGAHGAILPCPGESHARRGSGCRQPAP